MTDGLRRWLLPCILLAAALALDYLSKTWVRANLDYGQTQQFLPGLINLTRSVNTGGAFGIGRGNGILMTCLASAIVLAIVFWSIQRERSKSPLNTLERCGIATIIGGALGNLLDRITRGEVTDFLEFAFIQFPIFNVADALIDVGAGLVIIGTLAFSKNTSTESEHSTNASENQSRSPKPKDISTETSSSSDEASRG